MHFLCDGLKVSPAQKRSRYILLLALMPPLIFALFYPTVFFKALSFAGGICAMVLFGILPISMAWIGRYRKGLLSNYRVSGGKMSLIFAFFSSILVIGCEIFRLFS